MGHRLSKIYTRTGDQGTTGLGDGSRVDKDNLWVEAYGTVDELNSLLGLLLTHDLSNEIRELLVTIQHDLFDLGGELCIPGHCLITPAHSQFLEEQLDKFNDNLPMLKEFILPGGTPAAALCHVARTVCRRAERRVVTLMHQEAINTQGLIYLNRLSDLLFVLARVLTREGGQSEVLWQRDRNKHLSN